MSDLKKVDPNNLPAWMQEEEVLGVEDMDNFIVPPRIKIIQQQANKDLLAQFQPGDVIATPANIVVFEPERNKKGALEELPQFAFEFTPLFFFPEWCVWNDYKLKGQAPAIRDRSFDPGSTIAQKAKNPKLRQEPDPENAGMKLTYSQHLNFVVMLSEHPGITEPTIFSFSRGAHNLGQTLITKIRARKASLFGMRMEANLIQRTNNMGSWFALDCDNAEEPWVDDKETYEMYKDLYLEFKKHYEERRLRVDYEEEANEGDGEF